MISIYHSTSVNPAVAKLEKAKKGSWVHVSAPSDDELAALCHQYGLNNDLLRDAMDLYESPRVEEEDGSVYVYMRYYHENNGVVNATEPLLIIYTKELVVTVTRTDSQVLAGLLAGRRAVVTTQRTKLVLEIIQSVNASYQRYVTRLTRRVLSVRSKLRSTDIDSETLLGFIETEDDLNEFASALEPQAAMLRNLLSGKYIRLYEEDKDLVEDALFVTSEVTDIVKSRIKTIRAIRQSFDAVAASELNKTFRRLTSISIFLMIPTVFSGIYGMNVQLPFADDAHTFSAIFGLVILSSMLLVLVFRKKRWL
jgi:magnesium transporter